MDTKQSFEQLQNLESNMKSKKTVNFNNTNSDSVFVDEPMFNTGNFGDNQINKLNNTKTSQASRNKNNYKPKNDNDKEDQQFEFTDFNQSSDNLNLNNTSTVERKS